MKRLALLSILLLVWGIDTPAQSRRVPPGGGKENKRVPTPTPTPQVAETAAVEAPDSGDIVSIDTRLVTVPVRVMDRKNRFIGGLQQSSFKVFEDGIEQEIAYFNNELQPFTVALVLDMSYSTRFKISEIQSAAIAFIAQLRPEDRVMVIAFDQDVHMLCEATSDRGAIYRAIRRTAISTGTSLYEAVDLVLNDRMRREKGRKAIVLFTDGVDTTSTRSHDLKNLHDALEMDALIYPIRYDTFNDVQSMKNTTVINLPTSTPLPIPGVPVPVIGTPGGKGTTAEEYKAAEEYLTKLADLTGGRIYLATSVGSLNGSFAKIASELREFYSLGYYPAVEGVPGKTRRLKVKVDQPGVVVRARDSYVVPKQKRLRSS